MEDTDTEYRIYCNHCSQTIAKGKNLNTLMESFFWQLTKHNAKSIHEKVCEESKDELSFTNLETGFATGTYKVQVGEKTEKIEWSSL